MTDAATRGRDRPLADGVDRGIPAQRAKGRTSTSSLLFSACFLACRACNLSSRRLSSPRQGLFRHDIEVRAVTQQSEPSSSEPIFNVPPVVIATVGVLVLVHAFRMFVLTDEQDVEFLLTFAFIPARYGADLAAGARFRAASAPICGPSSPTLSSTPISCISGSISLGSYRSAPRWRGGSGRGAISCSCW